jgi:hypothetical protein
MRIKVTISYLPSFHDKMRVASGEGKTVEDAALNAYNSLAKTYPATSARIVAGRDARVLCGVRFTCRHGHPPREVITAIWTVEVQ